MATDRPLTTSTSGPLSIRRLLASESGRRVHVAKMITWRMIATGTTVLIAYLLIGDLRLGATIGGIEATAKMALYYGHERAWARMTTPPSPDAPAVMLEPMSSELV
ncbi:MAG: DUF2061 domain-containing protein [Actinomycetia bacterium]|nr:DUF2061 domain-containing protein [Actinomycetes bacterium]